MAFGSGKPGYAGPGSVLLPASNAAPFTEPDAIALFGSCADDRTTKRSASSAAPRGLSIALGGW
jgi:hypothetical protein